MRANVLWLRGAVFLIILITVSASASDWDRGVSHYNKGEFPKAIAEFQDIVQERPDAAGAWYYIGLCEFKLNAMTESSFRFRAR